MNSAADPEIEQSPPPAASAADSLAYGWTAFRRNPRAMLVVTAIPVAVQLGVALVGAVLIDSAARRFLFQIVGIVLATIASLGVRRLALLTSAGDTGDTVDTGDTDEVGDAVGARRAFDYDRLGQWVVFSVIFGVLEGIGLVLCVIPGALFVAFFGLAPFFFIDQGMSTTASLRASRRAVASHGLGFAVLLVALVGALGVVVFAVGAVVTEAVAMLALAFLYRSTAGRLVVEPES